MIVDTKLTSAAYHANPAVSKSLLDQIARSPAHARAYMDGVRTEPTSAMIFGTAFHLAALQPELYASKIATFDGDRRTKDGKASYEALVTSGKTIISRASADEISAMVNALRNHPVAARLMRLPGMAESSVFWTDPATGLECRCRPDWWVRGEGIIVDLKTTDDASPEGFARSVARYRYHVQDAHYRAGTGAEQFLFIAIEKEPPYAVGVYMLDEVSLALGQEARDRDLAQFAACIAANDWPGYSTEIQALSLPGWAFPKTETEEVEVNYV